MNEPEQLTIPGTQPQGSDALHTVVKLAEKLIQLDEEIENRCDELKKLTDERKNIGETLIPDLMSGIGLTELTLSGGRKITVKPEYYASIPKERMEAVADWLKERNMSGILKEQIVVEESYRSRLVEASVPFTPQSSIHPSTLKAFVKERIESGAEFPRDLFGVHVANKAVVKHG